MCRKEQPSLIILDHQLAGEMSGLEAAASLKEARPRENVIVNSSDRPGSPA